jgi:hypothetical protein
MDTLRRRERGRGNLFKTLCFVELSEKHWRARHPSELSRNFVLSITDLTSKSHLHSTLSSLIHLMKIVGPFKLQEPGIVRLVCQEEKFSRVPAALERGVGLAGWCQ